MLPSTSINLFFDPTFVTPVQEQIQRVYDAGFRRMDMNFWDWSHSPDSPFRADSWESWVDGIRGKADALGVRFTQAHAHVYNFYDHPDDGQLYDMYVRSLRGAAMLNVPYVTFHPSYKAELADGQGREKIIADNVAFFKPLVELAGRLNTGVALENLRGGLDKASELAELVDALSPFGPVGVCWDTGHAHISHVPQGESIRLMGRRLRALHVQDNDGITDWHMPPFFGSIDWIELMDALRAIGYEGDFTFEAHNIVRRVPQSVRAEAARLLYQIGSALVDG